MPKDIYQKLPIFHFAEEIKKRHAKKRLKCLIMGNFGCMNLGDEAILAGEIQELQKIPNLTVTVVARYPHEVTKIHKVNAVSFYAVNKIRREIKKSDFVIIGGGGLINKLERSVIGFGYQLYMLMVFFSFPVLYRKKIYILGLGIYSNANPFIVNLARPFFKNASIVTVRDHHSHEFLKSKNIVNTLYKDNSFLMDLAPVQEVMNIPFIKEHYRRERENIGISLLKPDNKHDETHLVNEIMKFMDNHAKKADFWFYTPDFNPAYDNDLKFSKRFIQEIQKKLDVDVTMHIVPTALPPHVYFSSFKLMDMFVAMRFHADVFAYRNKIPFAGISYDKKCQSFIESVGKTPLFLKSFVWEDIHKNVL